MPTAPAALQRNMGTTESPHTTTHLITRSDGNPLHDVTVVPAQNVEVGIDREDRTGDDETTVVSPDSSGYNSRDSNSPINVCD